MSNSTSEPLPVDQPRTGDVRKMVLQMSLVVVAQLLVAFSKFYDFKTVTELGGVEFEYSALVLSQLIIAVALIGGALQALLIFGSPALVNDKQLFMQFMRVGWHMTFALTLFSMLLMLGIGWGISYFSVAHGPELLEVYLSLMPAFALLCISEYLTMVLIIRERLVGLVLGISLMLMTKVVVYPYLLPVGLSFESGFVTQLAVSTGFATLGGVLILMVVASRGDMGLIGKPGLEKEVYREFWQVGLIIGAIVVVEVATFSVAQLFLWLADSKRGTLFATALHLFVLMETFAVAIGRLITSRISAALVTREKQEVNTEILWLLALSIGIHLLAALVMVLRPALVINVFIPEAQMLSSTAHAQLLLEYVQLAGVAQLLGGAVILMAAVLRALGDISSPVLLIALNYVVLGLGLSAIAVFVLTWLDYGAWIGVIVALFISVVFLAVRVFNNMRRIQS